MDLYDSALKRVRGIIEEEERSGVIQSSLCFNHGHPTSVSLLCYHGYTRSPAQFEEFAYRMFRQGVNVWIPRLPYHGLAKEQEREQGLLTLADLKSFVARHLDLIKSMGQRTVVMGLSGGGVLAAWGAGRYPGIEKTICLSPVIGVRTIPKQLHAILPEVMRWLPNRFIKWGDDEKEKDKGYYDEYSTKALGAFLELGLEVYKNRKQKLASPQVTMILNENDDKIDNVIVSRIVEGWISRDEQKINRIDFGGYEGLPHDLVGLDGVKENKERLYSLYEELVLSE